MGKSKTNYQQVIGQTNNNTAQPINQGESIISTIGIWLISIIALLVVCKICKRAFEILYDMVNARRIVYLRIMVPRGDTKSDREREKELAKDMKEKI